MRETDALQKQIAAYEAARPVEIVALHETDLDAALRELGQQPALT